MYCHSVWTHYQRPAATEYSPGTTHSHKYVDTLVLYFLGSFPLILATSYSFHYESVELPAQVCPFFTVFYHKMFHSRLHKGEFFSDFTSSSGCGTNRTAGFIFTPLWVLITDAAASLCLREQTARRRSASPQECLICYLVFLSPSIKNPLWEQPVTRLIISFLLPSSSRSNVSHLIKKCLFCPPASGWGYVSVRVTKGWNEAWKTSQIKFW